MDQIRPRLTMGQVHKVAPRATSLGKKYTPPLREVAIV